MTRYLPPTAGESERRIRPGPVKGGACPPPSEIVVIDARKVFDFCFQEETLERLFTVPGLGAGATVVDCEITNVTCEEIMEREPLPDQEGLALVSIRIVLELTITVRPSANGTPVTIQRTIIFPKRVVLCAPTGTDVHCDVRGTCICTIQPTHNTQSQSGVTEPNLACTIQLCIVVQSSADVKMLVPSFGLVVPQQCRVAPAFGGCPPIPPEVCGPLTIGEVED